MTSDKHRIAELNAMLDSVINQRDAQTAKLAEVTKERDLLAECVNAHKADAMRVMKLEKLNRDMVAGLNEALATLAKLEAIK